MSIERTTDEPEAVTHEGFWAFTIAGVVALALFVVWLVLVLLPDALNEAGHVG